MDLFDTIPGYREAVQEEKELRETAFIDAPELLCGVPVLPLQPRHVLILDGVGSPFLGGSNAVLPHEVARFFWIVSPNFTERVTVAARWNRYKMTRTVAKLKMGDACESIARYVDDAFSDSLGSEKSSSKPFSSWVSGYVHVLAREYGWTDDKVLRTPLKRIFQLLRHIQRDNNPSAMFIDRSDRVRGRWLAEQNSKAN